jgi:hypothetical protein
VGFNTISSVQRGRTGQRHQQTRPTATQVQQDIITTTQISEGQETRKSAFVFGRLLSTRSDPVLTIVRLVVGIVFFAHGAQRVFGWFGDGGFEGTMHFSLT